ncbi:DNA repair protein rad50, partial [Nowakowskiella sp. JEL0078]
MSSLDKLLISGIRSFAPDQSNVIEFFSPLTLIVGHNGSGKTTIIECLKYATTGELPPNSKHGAFIHDPKISGETQVKAQVKLRFKSINGKEIVTTRNVTLTQNKTSSTQKSLEGVIKVTDLVTGEVVISASISSRCAELDAEIPMHLGVSTSILDNVIFCHQEESHWPLSEPAPLKKKFDEIFAATRYTKALEEIKTIRKKKAADLKVSKDTLIRLTSDKIKAEK